MRIRRSGTAGQGIVMVGSWKNRVKEVEMILLMVIKFKGVDYGKEISSTIFNGCK